MPWNSRTGPKPSKTQANAWVFLSLALAASLLTEAQATVFASSPPSSSSVKDELTREERKTMIDQLLREGDQYLATKNYNLANQAYESVFLLEPNHAVASKRIDRLKKEMLGEGRSEAELVARVYDTELQERIGQYLERARELMAKGKWGQARFALQKLLLLNPLHEEANRLYQEVIGKSKEAASSFDTKRSGLRPERSRGAS